MTNMIPIGRQEEWLAFPYNSEPGPDGLPDRAYDCQDFADYFRLFIGSGVYALPAGGLSLAAAGGFVVNLRRGAAFLQGRAYLQHADFSFNIPAAHLTLGRRDIVVIRHDIVARNCQPWLVVGTPAATPVVPQIERTDDVFDLQVATITINPNAQGITQANILDTRMNNNLCGIVTGVVTQADTTGIFEQYLAYLHEQMAAWDAKRDGFMADHAAWRDNHLAWREDWRAQNLEWARLWQAQQEAFAYEMRLMVQAHETLSFTRINHNFDDISTKRGCSITTEFAADGSITEAIRIIDTGATLATRKTTFNADGSITEMIAFAPWQSDENQLTAQTLEFSISKRTIFNQDGTITEEIR